MSLAIIAGSPAPQQMPVRMVWRRLGGFEFERRWWGEASAVQAMFEGVRAQDAVAEVTFDQQPGSPIGILTARYVGSAETVGGSAGLDVVETMEIDFADESFKLHLNPSFINIPTEDLQDLEEAIKENTRDVLDAYQSSDAEYHYYELRARGVETYRAFLPVVTWTRTVNTTYPAELDLEGVGAIYTTGAMVNSLGTPRLFDIPTGNVGVDAGSQTVFRPGWLKTGSAHYASDGKLQIMLRGEYGNWAYDLYPDA